MITYVKYFVIWLLFMALIAGITLLVPKVSKPIERWIKQKRENMKSDKETTQLPTAPDAQDLVDGEKPDNEQKTE